MLLPCFSLVFRRKQRLMTLDVYTRHKELINQYYLCYPGAAAKLQRDTSRDRTDYDVLKDNHRFLWDDNEVLLTSRKFIYLQKKFSYDKYGRLYSPSSFWVLINLLHLFQLMKAAEKSWEARLAKRYYDKLFKEYCIADLSQYRKNR